MPRAAHRKLDSKTSRLRLKPRAKAYFTSLQPKILLGYVRRPGTEAGRWVVQRQLGRNENNDPIRRVRTLGTADDYIDADGKDILTFEQARAMAFAPGTVAGTGPLTVAQAIDRYVEGRESRAHADADRQRLLAHLPDNLLNTEVTYLTKGTLEKWRNALVAQGDDETVRKSKDSANRVLTILKASLNHAFQDDANHIPTDKAWRTVKAFKDVGAARLDHFTEKETRHLIDKARETNPAFADLIEAAFHTGARPPGELAVIDVGHFDAKNAQITIPAGKTGERVVTLTKDGVAFFKRVSRGKGPRDIMLPRADGNRWGKSEQHRPMKAALKAAKLPESASMYSVRHTYISRAIERNMPLNLIAENVGTSVRMIEQNYAKFLAQKRRALVQQFAPALPKKAKHV